ncbi:DEKNAAC102666 [Brettanomyces naardenensis]|uniref:Holocytochrome c-type synthase n=1 Tax=Brettanomyces naardenensis TaxID=13370 RepID=A0A448YL56_BRENA|nr:DEKNAAC102666 [Brettanomyces naardenensis]
MSSDQSGCPVDPQTRELWIQKARANRARRENSEAAHVEKVDSEATSSSKSFSWKSLLWADTPKECPVNHDRLSQACPVGYGEGGPSVRFPCAEEQCPVSEEARSVWLSAGGKAPLERAVNATEAIESCSSDNIDQLEGTDDINVPSLSDQRQISSIPRTGEEDNWVYPSQKQFYKAMKRKQWNPEAQDMKTVVPLHNMVNEVAWNYIQYWEKGEGGDKCGGIKLTSFKGNSHKLTPRAFIRHYVFGNPLPFDRHDWTIDRCGTKVEYVIDFYSKVPDKDSKDSEPTFYLDVRPKLNSVEGWRLRIGKAFK